MREVPARQQAAIDGLEPWQRQLVNAVLAGDVDGALRHREASRRAGVFFAALYELEGRRWDAVGPTDQARELRRQARELAAHLAWCPCGDADA